MSFGDFKLCSLTQRYSLNIKESPSQILCKPPKWCKIERAITAAENHFDDVSDTAWYKNAANWAQENGIVAGVGGGLFAPNATATREQIALIMMKFSAFRGEDVSPRDELAGYNDVGSISPWAIDAVKWAVANGLISGKGNGMLDPKGTATRAETAQILFRYLTKKYKEIK